MSICIYMDELINRFIKMGTASSFFGKTYAVKNIDMKINGYTKRKWWILM